MRAGKRSEAPVSKPECSITMSPSSVRVQRTITVSEYLSTDRKPREAHTNDTKIPKASTILISPARIARELRLTRSTEKPVDAEWPECVRRECRESRRFFIFNILSRKTRAARPAAEEKKKPAINNKNNELSGRRALLAHDRLAIDSPKSFD